MEMYNKLFANWVNFNEKLMELSNTYSKQQHELLMEHVKSIEVLKDLTKFNEQIIGKTKEMFKQK